MNQIRAIQALNKKELEAGIYNPNASWHVDYRDTAWVAFGGLPFSLSEGDVITIFSQYGEPVHIKLARDKETGKSRGFGWLKYEDQRSTDLAVDNLGGAEIGGRLIRVDHARYKFRDDEDPEEGKCGWQDIQRTERAVRGDDVDIPDGTEEEEEEQQRPLIKEERELAILIEEHDEDDPMKAFLIEEKKKEIEDALARSEQKERRHKHRDHHHHSHRSRQDEEASRGNRDHDRDRDRDRRKTSRREGTPVTENRTMDEPAEAREKYRDRDRRRDVEGDAERSQRRDYERDRAPSKDHGRRRERRRERERDRDRSSKPRSRSRSPR